jgi:hypothetical protein
MAWSQGELEAHLPAVQDAMPAHVRVARATALFAWTRDLIGREIVAGTEPLSDARVKRETALRLYGSDATSRKLIQRMLDHGSA